MVYPCNNKLCPDYGNTCWKHCNHCTESIIWRPPGLDPEIKYAGPKPLNPNGSLHRCMKTGYVKQYKKITGDPIIDNCNYFKELHQYLQNIHFSYNSSQRVTV